MATSGIRRKVDDLGRVVIPVGLRRNLGIDEGDLLEFSIEDERIILARPSDRCVLCASDANLVDFRGRCVCSVCVADLEEARGKQGVATPQIDQVVTLPEPEPASKTAW